MQLLFTKHALDQGLKSIDTAMFRTSQATNEAIDSLSALIAAAGIGMGLDKIKDLLWECAEASIEFESALAGVRKTTNFSVTEMDAIKNELISLSQQIPLTTTELAKIAEIGGQLNIPRENIIDFTKVMADLGVTTTMTSAEAADFVARFSNITQMPQENFDRLGAALVQLGNNFAGTESEIAAMALRLASAGKQMGLSGADTLGLSAALVAVGIKAEMGGTAFSKAMNRINIAINTGNKELEDFARVAGMSVEQFVQTFETNANSALIAFVQGFADIERHGKNTIVLMDGLGITEARMSDALRRAAGSGETFSNAIAMSNQAFDENIALQNEAQIRYETTESKIQLLSNASNELKIVIGDSLTPTINSLAGGMTDVTLAMAEFIKNNQWVIQSLTVLGVLVGTTVGGIALYTAAIKALTIAKAAFTTVTKGADIATKGFMATLAVSPLGAILAISAVAAAITGLTIGISNYNSKQAESRRIALDAANAAVQQSINLQNLYSKYEMLSGIANKTVDEENEFRDVQSQIIPLLNERTSALAGLTEGTKEYADAVREATDAELTAQLNEIRRGRVAAGDELKNSANAGLFGWGNQGFAFGPAFYNDNSLYGQINKIMSSYVTDGGGGFPVVEMPKDAELQLQFYANLRQSLELLDVEYNKLYNSGDRAGAEAIAQSQLYKDLTNTINTMQEPISKYLDLKVQEQQINYVLTNGYPKTIEELNTIKDVVFNNVGAHESYKNIVSDIVDRAFPSLTSGINNVSTKIEGSTSTSISAFEKLSTAINAWNDAQTETERTYRDSQIKDVLKELHDEAVKGTISWKDYDDALSLVSASTTLAEYATEDLKDKLSEIDTAYSTVKGAVEEYKENQSLSYDTTLKLLNLGEEYLAYLFDENGNLVLNEEAFRNLAIAKLEDLKTSKMLEMQDLITKLQDEGKTIAELKDEWIRATAAKRLYAEDVNVGEYGELPQVQAYLNQIKLIEQAINNVGTKPSSVLGSSNRSSSSKKETEIYKVEIDATMLLEARLQKVNELLTQNDKLFNAAAGSTDKQAELMQKRISLLEEQKALLHQINNLNREDISKNIQSLADYGINIKFTPELNLLEFEQSTEEIQNILNNIKIGSIEDSNKVKKDLESMLDSIIKMNEANDKNSSQWQEIQRTINEINFELINLDYSKNINDATRALDDYDIKIKALAQNDFDGKIALTNEKLNVQKSLVTVHTNHLQTLQNALYNGAITSEQFSSAVNSTSLSLQNAAISVRDLTNEVNQLNLNMLNEQKSAINDIVEMTKNLMRQEVADDVKRINTEIEKLNDKKKANSDIEKDLNNALKERNKLDQDRKKALSDELKAANKRDNDTKKALDEELKAAKKVADARKKAADDELKSIKAAADDRKKALNDELKLQRENAAETKKRLDAELKAYKEIIDARKKSLDIESDDRYYEQGLESRQKEIQKINDRLVELQNNDSLSAKAERSKLLEDLAQKELDLANYIFDNDIKRQKDALDSEYDRYAKTNQAEKDAIDDSLKEFEKAHQDKIDMIDKELEAYQRNHDDLIDAINRETEARQEQHDNTIKMLDAQMEARQNNYDNTIAMMDKEREAYEDMINKQIEGLQRESEEYDRQMEDKRKQIEDLQATIANNGKLTRDAYAKINQEMNDDADAFLQKLLGYNAEYGSGLDEDVLEPWRRFGDVTVQNNDYLEKMRSTMQEIANITNEIANAQSTLGLRDYFEGQGYEVGWNGDTRQFSVDGQWFDSSGYTNLGGSLQATYQQLLDLEKQLMNLPQYDKGGRIDRDQLALIHAGERVLTPDENKVYESGKLVPLEFSMLPSDQIGNVMDNFVAKSNTTPDWLRQTMLGNPINNVTTNNNQQPVNIENTFNGVTSENFMRELPKVMNGVVDKGIKEYNRQRNMVCKARGLTGGVNIRNI